MGVEEADAEVGLEGIYGLHEGMESNEFPFREMIAETKVWIILLSVKGV